MGYFFYRVNSFTLLQKPEYFISEDGESTGSKTPIDSVSVISTASDDVIVEGRIICNLLMVFNATFNNISVILWRSVLLVEETRENH